MSRSVLKCPVPSTEMSKSVPKCPGTEMSRIPVVSADHNCLVLINCQYFCTSSSLIYDSKVDRCVFDNSTVDRSRRSLFLYIDFYLYFHYFDLHYIVSSKSRTVQYRVPRCPGQYRNVQYRVPRCPSQYRNVQVPRCLGFITGMVSVDRSRRSLFLYIDFYLYFHYFDLHLLFTKVIMQIMKFSVFVKKAPTLFKYCYSDNRSL
jgi:hypothetical protein